MHTFHLRISSPDGDAFRGEAVMLRVRGSEGDLAVLADHIPFITSVKPCQARVILPDETEKTWQVTDGLLTVRENKVTLLCGHVE